MHRPGIGVDIADRASWAGLSVGWGEDPVRLEVSEANAVAIARAERVSIGKTFRNRAGS